MRPQLPRTPPRETKRNPTLVSKFSTSPPRRTFTTLVKSVKDVVSKANLSGHFSKRDSTLTVKDKRRRKPGCHHSLRYIRSSRLAPSRSSIILHRGVDRIMLGERVRCRPTSETGSLSNAMPTLGSLCLLNFFPLPQSDPSATESSHLTSIEITSQVVVSPSLEAQGPSSNDDGALPMFLPAALPPSTVTIRDHDPNCSIQGSQNSRSFFSIDTVSSGSYYDDTFAETLDNVFDISWDSTDALHDDPGMGSGSRNSFIFSTQVQSGNPLTRRYDQNLSPVPEAELNSLAGVRPLHGDNNRGPSSFSARSEPISFVSLLNEVHSSRPKTIIEESEAESFPYASSVLSQISPAAAGPLTCPPLPSGLLVPSPPLTVFPCGTLLKPHECHDLARAEKDHSRSDVDLNSNHDSVINLEHGAEPIISEPSLHLDMNLPFQTFPRLPATLTDVEDVDDSASQISHAFDVPSRPIQIPEEIGSKFDFKGDQEPPLLPIDDHNHGQTENIEGRERTIDIDAANTRKRFRPLPPVPARSPARPSGASPFFLKSPRSVSFAGPPSLPRGQTTVTSSAGPRISFVTLFKNLRRPKSADASEIDSNVKKPNKIKPVLTPIHIEHPTDASAYSIIQEYDDDPFAMSPPLKSRTVHTKPSLAVRSDSLISLPYLPLDPMPHKNFHLPTRLTESTLRLHTTLSAAFAHSDSSSFSGATNTNATLVGSSPIYPPSSATTVFSRFTASDAGPQSTGWPASSPQSITGGNETKIDNGSHHPTLIFSQANASEPVISLSPPLYDIALSSGTREDGDERGARVLHTPSIGLGDPSWDARHSRNQDMHAAQLRATRRKMSMLEIGYTTLDLSALP